MLVLFRPFWVLIIFFTGFLMGMLITATEKGCYPTNHFTTLPVASDGSGPVYATPEVSPTGAPSGALVPPPPAPVSAPPVPLVPVHPAAIPPQPPR